MPGKKGGKGKGKKKENLTDEQKKKLADEKAKAEQEKIVRRREVTNAFLRLKKEKEYDLIKLNTNKLLDLWRPRLRKLKIDELMDDYNMMRNAFERAFDRKRNLMKELQDNLDKNQSDYDSAVDSHMYNIDKLMEFYKNRLTEVREAYIFERTKLVNTLNEERTKIQSYQNKSLKQLRNGMTQITNHFKEQGADSEADFALREEEIRNKGIEEVTIIKSKMDTRMKDMWTEMHDRLVSYDANVTRKKAEYLDFREKDLVISSLIDSQFCRLYALQDGIKNLTIKTALFEKALNHFIGALQKKKKEYRDSYDKLMTRHQDLVSISSSAVRLLALESFNVHEKMDDMFTQRKRLLRLIERCRKHERMDEKIDPFLLKWGLNHIFEEKEEKKWKKSAKQNQNRQNESIAIAMPKQPKNFFYTRDFEMSGKYNVHVSPIVHDLPCDCNPCICETSPGSRGGFYPANRIGEEDEAEEEGGSTIARQQEQESIARSNQLVDTRDLETSGQYLLHVKPIVHEITCDCNPCMCETNHSDHRVGLEIPAYKLVQEFAILEHFWIRHNRVSLERAALGVRREALMTDNTKLKLALRNYMGGLNPVAENISTVHDRVMAQENKRNTQLFNRFVHELKRRERCRKVGGIRVH